VLHLRLFSQADCLRSDVQVLLTALALCALLAAPAAAKQNRGGRVTLAPTSRPTRSPTAAPTKAPTKAPTAAPTKAGTPTAPSAAPTSAPVAPIASPTAAPTVTPGSTAPTAAPVTPAPVTPGAQPAGKWNPLPPPAGEKCEQPRTDKGRPAEVSQSSLDVQLRC
jgi:hypothetical protein